MRLTVEDWVFEVDTEATAGYAAEELRDHCTCGYCRNFYAAVDGKYPSLRAFLAQFGLQLEAPTELFPYEPTVYEASYVVAGTILRQGRPVECGGLTIAFEAESQINHSLHGPVFFLTTGLLELPWVLDEPAEEILSPANEPSFLRKMRRRILKKALKDKFPS